MTEITLSREWTTCGCSVLDIQSMLMLICTQNGYFSSIAQTSQLYVNIAGIYMVRKDWWGPKVNVFKLYSLLHTLASQGAEIYLDISILADSPTQFIREVDSSKPEIKDERVWENADKTDNNMRGQENTSRRRRGKTKTGGREIARWKKSNNARWEPNICGVIFVAVDLTS